MLLLLLGNNSVGLLGRRAGDLTKLVTAVVLHVVSLLASFGFLSNMTLASSPVATLLCLVTYAGIIRASDMQVTDGNGRSSETHGIRATGAAATCGQTVEG